jgi:hypothetical protein
VLAKDALSLADGGAPLTIPTGSPTAKPIEYTNWDEELVAVAQTGDPPMRPVDLGRLRVEVMRQLAALPNDDSEPSDDIKQGLFYLAAEALRTVSGLVSTSLRPSILWNEELDPSAFLGRTLLLADHVAMSDDVFQALLRRGSNRTLRRTAERALAIGDLIGAGVVIHVPIGVAMAVSGLAASELTDRDLKDVHLVSWVLDQLILEGPTAREAFFVRAGDEMSMHADKFWLHGHIDANSVKDDGTFTTKMLQPYDPTYDYGPWIKQVSDSAVGYYVQRTNERIVTADVYGAEYVTASMFEARLMARSRRGRVGGAAQAAVWADVPQLQSLTGPELIKLTQNEDAVEDLRRQVRASLITARTPGEQSDALTALAHEMEASSHRLEKTVRSDKLWQAAVPGGLGAASLVLGSLSGGLLPMAAGAAGLLGSVAPFLGARVNARREAAYLFVTARRVRRQSFRRPRVGAAGQDGIRGDQCPDTDADLQSSAATRRAALPAAIRVGAGGAVGSVVERHPAPDRGAAS